jgi:uncharacterized repeat protein (TIGR02543 family)
MNHRLSVFAISLLMLASPMVLLAQDADAADATHPDYYCYSHDILLYYTGGTHGVDSVVWELTGVLPDGSTRVVGQTGTPSDSDAWAIHTVPEDVDGCETLLVKQTVTKGDDVASDTWTIGILPAPADSHTVRFLDGYTGTCVKSAEFKEDTIINGGEDFVTAPAAPERDDYDFLGWFHSDLVTPFDPKDPVVGDTDIYARWAHSGSSPGGSGLVVNGYIVTFQVSPGLQYTILEVGQSSVRFTVTEVDGPIVADMSSLEVTSDNGSYLLNNGNVWTLLEVHGNVMVYISASISSGGDDFPWWVVILITVMMVSAAGLMFYRIKNQ